MEERAGRKIKKKINLIGDPSVGKTSLILRYVKNVFGDDYLKTIGTNIYTKDIQFSEGNIKLIVQDIMGETKFDLVQERAFIGSTGAIAVVDVLRKDTLDSIIYNWIPRYYKLTSEENPVVLAVNKFDLEDKDITPEELESAYHLFDATVYTSAKTGRNVEYLFKNIASRVAYNLQISLNDAEDIIDSKEIDTPFELLDALFMCSSLSNKMTYKERDDILQQSGINKYDLNEDFNPIDEDEATTFGRKLIEWCEENGDKNTAKISKKALNKYWK